MFCNHKFRHLVIFNSINCLLKYTFCLTAVQIPPVLFLLCLKVNISPKTQVDRKWKYIKNFLYAKFFLLMARQPKLKLIAKTKKDAFCLCT